MTVLTMERWSPYIVGMGIGLVACLGFLFSDNTMGCSAAFSRTSGMIEKLFRGAHVKDKPYYKKFPPVIDWEWMLVLGVLLGSFLSAALSGQFKIDFVPEKWASVFGTSISLRLISALIGGIFVGLGSRWAGGCTSGHGITGTLQLAVSSWIAAFCFFIGGIAVALFIFKVLFI
jgi:hypothetical protein